MNKRVPIKKAAKELGMAECELRYKMKTNKEFELGLGFVLPPKEKGGNWRYFIYRNKLNKLTGGEDEAQGN